jgi:leucyl aminopeptidase
MTKITISTKTPSQPTAKIHTHFSDHLPSDWPSGLFSAKEAEILVLPDKDSHTTIHIGLGQREKLNSIVTRRCFLAALRRASTLKEKNWQLNWSLPEELLLPALTGATEGVYNYDAYKPQKDRSADNNINIQLYLKPDAKTNPQLAIKIATAFARGSELCRNLANAPGNELPPLELARQILHASKNYPSLKIEILKTSQLRSLRMGGILAVGGGSANPPCLIVIHHTPQTAKIKKSSSAKKTLNRPLVLVGKAITFDSGGISIKPAENMEEMKFDKSGGCAVAGALIAAAHLGIDREIIGIIPSAENLPSHTSYRPGDIITCHDGTTVEIINTDAEGRLILADALSYASRKYNPAAIIDLATLTGACVVALGTHRAGLFCENEKLKSSLLRSADTTGDLLWPLPHDEPYYEQIKSKIATIKNTGGRWGGACTAAAFLRHFVPGEIPWAHLDIAGVSWNSNDSPSRPTGATGFGVALLLHWLLENDKF